MRKKEDELIYVYSVERILQEAFQKFYGPEGSVKKYTEFKKHEDYLRIVLMAMHQHVYNDLQKYCENLKKLEIDIQVQKIIAPYRVRLFHFFLKRPLQMNKEKFLKKHQNESLIWKKKSVYATKQFVANELLNQET
jgi:hypothetical protein